jgi:hypothetical protein
MTSKLLLFWRQFTTLEVAITGSSEAVNGINPAYIKGYSAFNFAAHGGGLAWQKLFIVQYCLPHSSRLKLICSSLDPGWLALPGGSFSCEQGLKKSTGYMYDSLRQFWRDSSRDEAVAIMSQLSLPVPYPLEQFGYIGMEFNGWGSMNPECVGSVSWDTSDVQYQSNMDMLASIAEICRERRVHWVVVNFPVSPYFRNTEYYSIWGPSRETAAAVIERLRQLTSNNDYFHFYDANIDGLHDYGTFDAADPNHLSTIGAIKLTTRLDSLFHTILE